MTNNNKEIEKEFFGLLQEHQIALNPQLEQVVRFFFSHESHFTLKEIEDYAIKRNLDLSGDIIERVLRLLLDYGFARQRIFDDGEVRYEHLHLNEHHDHFFCIHCKNIIEFSSKSLEKEQDFMAEQFEFHPFWHKLEIYGLCNNCFSKNKGSSFPLILIQLQANIEIVEISIPKKKKKWITRGRTGNDVDLPRRIHELGLVPGTRAKVVSNNLGLVILEVRGSRMALGKGMSQCVMVKLVD